jgi:hypothetical protein
MEGGVAIILAIVLVVLIVGGGVFLYITGALTSVAGDRTAREDETRPRHKEPGDEVQENTEFVGTRRDG